MQKIIENPRSGCGLHGAVSTILEIRGAVPIVHSNAGCAVSSYLANQSSGMENSFIGGYEVPGTNVQERHVIFGGASRLREQIKNTLKVVNGELYVVLNSCESAMVGDDIDAMTKEVQEQGEQVIDSLIAGFHGDSHYGYEQILVDIIRKLPKIREVEEEKETNLVNIFGILPQKDLYFKGDLEEIKRILEGIGVKVNTFFGPVDGVEEFARAPQAALTVTFSKWGQKAAKELEKTYQIPFLSYPSVPTGIRQVRKFVKEIQEKLGLDAERTEQFLRREEERFLYYFGGVARCFYDEHVGCRIALAGDESNVLRYGSFLKEYLGVTIDTAVITDMFLEEHVSESEKIKQWQGFAENVHFSQDGNEIETILGRSHADLILASSLEDALAERLGIVNFAVSYPVYDRAVLNKSYAGITGALNFTEDFITRVKESRALKERKLDEWIQG